MAAPKGHPAYAGGGRPKGSKGKIQREVRDKIKMLVTAELDNGHVFAAMAELYEQSKKDYLLVFTKLAEKVLPKQQEVTIQDGIDIEASLQLLEQTVSEES